jgi:hypothetical protein
MNTNEPTLFRRRSLVAWLSAVGHVLFTAATVHASTGAAASSGPAFHAWPILAMVAFALTCAAAGRKKTRTSRAQTAMVPLGDAVHSSTVVVAPLPGPASGRAAASSASVH